MLNNCNIEITKLDKEKLNMHDSSSLLPCLYLQTKIVDAPHVCNE